MKKLVIIPAYNEADCIKDTVNELVANAPSFDYIVINDGSSDATGEMLKNNKLNYIDLPINLGIGGAVQTGYRYAFENGYDYAIQFDADGQHDCRFLESMVEKLESCGADMVIGSRFIERNGFQSTRIRRVGIVFFTYLIRILTGKKVTDPTSGFRMVDRDIIGLFADDYPRDYPEPESTTYLLKMGMKVEEIPVVMKERQGGESSISFRVSIYYMIKVTLAVLLRGLLTKKRI